MFTGIVQAVGKISALTRQDGDARVRIDTGKLDLSDVKIGDSISVSGVCLTALETFDNGFTADISGETLARTTFSTLRIGAAVNLEKSLTPTSSLGGHWVSGHVDGSGSVIDRRDAARSVQFRIQAPDALAKYIAEKGSICVDGVSLTVNTVQGAEFDVNIVPHSLQATTLGDLAFGRMVNLEVDILARYLERLVLGDRAALKDTDITREFLAQQGFLNDRR